MQFFKPASILLLASLVASSPVASPVSPRLTSFQLQLSFFLLEVISFTDSIQILSDRFDFPYAFLSNLILFVLPLDPLGEAHGCRK